MNNKKILNKIVYLDKQNFQELPTIPEFQKATAKDFNQIKNIVNSTIDEINLNISPEIQELEKSTVKLTTNQFIDGIKTFINSGGAITFNADNQSQFLEFKNNNISICFIGKLNELNNDISIVSNSGKLFFSAKQGCFFESLISGIQNPINDDNPANKIYVDDNDQKLNSLILNLENLLNNLAKDFNKLRPFNFKGKYDPNFSYLKNDAVDDPKGYLFISVIDNNLNNPLTDENFWISAGPEIDLTDYYSKIVIDQKLNLKADKTELVNKQDKLTAGTNISIVGDVISSTGGAAGVTLDTAQNITGIKTFTNGIKNNLVEVNGKSLIVKNSGGGSNYFEIEQTYTSGYKNWFGVLFFRTTGTSREELSSIQVRQDDGLYISTGNDLILNAANIKFSNARLQQVRTPTADDDAATKKYADDGLNLKVDKTEIAAIDAAIELNTNNITKNSADILLKADKTELVNKQDKLTAGTNISIVGDVISSTGGAAGVTLDTAQNITGIKTFTNGIKNNLVEVNGKSLIVKNSGGGSNYFEIEQTYTSGYKNWFGVLFFRTTGTSREELSSIQVRQDDGLYISTGNDLVLNAANIKVGDKRIQQVGAPTADYDAATKKYADDRLNLKVDKTAIAAIDAAIELNTNNITKNADDILLKANETEITAIDAKLVINTNNITKNADDILLKADKTEITALDTKLTLNTNDISDNTAGILLKADKTELVNKQDKLTAGTNISIVGDVISSAAGGGVTIDTAQNITGIKTFTNGIKNNFVEVDGKSLIIKNSNTSASYLEVESVYSGSGYKNWFGIQLFRTTGTSRSRLANLEIRQDDGLYIACVNDVSIQGSNIKFNNVRLQQVGAPTADYDAATKKYVDDAVAAALKPYLIDLQKRKES